MHYLPPLTEHAPPSPSVRRGSARTRLLVTIAFAMGVAALPVDGTISLLGWSTTTWLTIASAALLGVIVRTGVSWRFLFMRSAWFLPGMMIVSVVATGAFTSPAGLRVACVMVAKAWLALLAMLVLVRTSRGDELLHALRQLGLPNLLVAALGSMRRYSFVLSEELTAIARAQRARTFRHTWSGDLRDAADRVAAAWVRSLDRSNRVHQAMLARGFSLSRTPHSLLSTDLTESRHSTQIIN